MKKLIKHAIIGLALFTMVALFFVVSPAKADDLSAQIEAALQTDPLPADEVPPVGMFYLASDPARPPLPCNLQQLSAWNLGNNNWLLDDVDENTGFHSMRGRSMAMDVPSPGDGGDIGGGDYTNYFYSSYSLDTNGLYLTVSNAGSYVLHNATNEVYSIWSTRNLSLPFASGNVELELWPTDAQTNAMPFTLQNVGLQSLFIRAMDWTDVWTNGLPDWWVWKYFGDLSETSTNLDSQGNTLGYDYTNDIIPMTFTFTNLEVANNYVGSSSPSVQLDVEGSPYCIAVLVDDNNFSNAVWNTYSGSTVTANLGIIEGWHDVWIGLRDHADNDGSAVWWHKRLKLDFTPPLIVISSPTNANVNVPMIQLTGFSPEALSNINYDLTNALGLITNQQVLVLDQFYDTNSFEFTTNIFQAFDVALTNGLNTFTFHATDLAGNVATLVTNFTLDYSSKTNSPTIQIAWPQNGVQISGSNFTCRGWVSDPTAAVSMQLIFTDGDTNIFAGGIYTNTYPGTVGRNGNFWLDNLPLNTGTNTLPIVVTDVVGNTTVTNITVIQSSLVLTMNPVSPDSQLWQPTVNLTGTISDATYAVWVNGVKGTNNADGTWSANNVPVNKGGTANFDITGYAPSEQQPDGSYGN